MERLDNVVRVATACGVAIGVLLSNEAATWLARYSLPAWFPRILTLGIIFISAEIVREASHLAISAVRPLRRLILSRKFVEGSWIDVAYSNGKPIASGLIRIESEGTGLRVSGNLFDLSGSPQGSFKSEMAMVAWPAIRHKYSAIRSNNANHDDFQGYSEIQFMERDGPPLRYQGYFCDLMQGDRGDLLAARLKEEDARALLDSPELCGILLLEKPGNTSSQEWTR